MQMTECIRNTLRHEGVSILIKGEREQIQFNKKNHLSYVPPF